MYQDNITLCGASAYEKKFYFNQDFNALPDHVKKELQIMCVLYTEDVSRTRKNFWNLWKCIIKYSFSETSRKKN